MHKPIDFRDPLSILGELDEQSCKGCAFEPLYLELIVCNKGRRFGERCSEYRGAEGMSKCPEHVRQAMFDWGRYARRPQLWENLKARNIYGTLPVPSKDREIREIFLDPASARIHKAVMALDCEKTKGVLYAYYVCGTGYAASPEVFKRYGISKAWFYELVHRGSVMAVNASKLVI